MPTAVDTAVRTAPMAPMAQAGLVARTAREGLAALAEVVVAAAVVPAAGAGVLGDWPILSGAGLSHLVASGTANGVRAGGGTGLCGRLRSS
jgi:hypothetical protein